MKEGERRMMKRVKTLLEGGTVPVLERPLTEESHEITGWEPAKHYEHSYILVPKGIRIDQQGTLYITQTVDLVKPRLASGWQISKENQALIIKNGEDEKIHKSSRRV